MALVGPGAVEEDVVAVGARLDGASEYEYVTIHNPLSDDFAIKVAQDIPVNMPFNIGKDVSGKTAQTTLSERDAAQTYGLSLKNPDFQGRKHISNNTVIKAGATINLKGNEAQVAVKQLVDAILQREGKSRLIADPKLRREIEDTIIVRRGSIQELMDGGLRSQRAQIDEALLRSNEQQNGEESTITAGADQTPGADDSGAGEAESAQESDGASPKRVGRPRKAN